MEGQPEVVAATSDLVNDVDGPRCPVQPHAPPVPGRRVELPVSVMLGGPFDRVADVTDLDDPRGRVPYPQERATLTRLTRAVELDRVVGDRGAEIGTPLVLAVVTVRARIGQDVDAAVPNLGR